MVLNSVHSCAFAFLGIVMNIDFSNSVGIYPVLYIILQSFVICYKFCYSLSLHTKKDIVLSSAKLQT